MSYQQIISCAGRDRSIAPFGDPCKGGYPVNAMNWALSNGVVRWDSYYNSNFENEVFWTRDANGGYILPRIKFFYINN